MKRESPRSASQPKPVPLTARHQFEHQAPTHIHDPEQNMMVLARWTHRAMQNPTRFWGSLAGIVVGVLAAVLLATTFWTGMSRNAEVWTQLETVKSPADRVKIAEEFPDSPASTWARLEAASDYYHLGVDDLPNNRDVALPTLKKALDNFDEVAKTAPKDSPQARVAAMGKARTLEARGELPKAIEQYDLVEKNWPGTAEGEHAKRLASELKKADAAAFYKELYAYTPAKVTLPPMGKQDFNMPLFPAPSGLTGPAEAVPGGSLPSFPLLPPPPPTPAAKTEPAPAKGKEATPPATKVPAAAPVLPASPFDTGGPASKASSTAAPAAKTEAPKPAAKTDASKTETPKK